MANTMEEIIIRELHENSTEREIERERERSRESFNKYRIERRSKGEWKEVKGFLFREGVLKQMKF